MQVATTIDGDNGMVVKRLSVPIGLEELMESLTKQVLIKKPKDLYSFASQHFAHLVAIRENLNKTTDTQPSTSTNENIVESKKALKIKSATAATKFNKLPTPIVFTNSKTVQSVCTPKLFQSETNKIKSRSHESDVTPRNVHDTKTKTRVSSPSKVSPLFKRVNKERAKWKKQEITPVKKTPRENLYQRYAKNNSKENATKIAENNEKGRSRRKATDVTPKDTPRTRRDATRKPLETRTTPRTKSTDSTSSSISVHGKSINKSNERNERVSKNSKNIAKVAPVSGTIAVANSSSVGVLAKESSKESDDSELKEISRQIDSTTATESCLLSDRSDKTNKSDRSQWSEKIDGTTGTETVEDEEAKETVSGSIVLDAVEGPISDIAEQSLVEERSITTSVSEVATDGTIAESLESGKGDEEGLSLETIQEESKDSKGEDQQNQSVSHIEQKITIKTSKNKGGDSLGDVSYEESVEKNTDNTIKVVKSKEDEAVRILTNTEKIEAPQGHQSKLQLLDENVKVILVIADEDEGIVRNAENMVRIPESLDSGKGDEDADEGLSLKTIQEDSKDSKGEDQLNESGSNMEHKIIIKTSTNKGGETLSDVLYEESVEENTDNSIKVINSKENEAVRIITNAKKIKAPHSKPDLFNENIKDILVIAEAHEHLANKESVETMQLDENNLIVPISTQSDEVITVEGKPMNIEDGEELCVVIDADAKIGIKSETHADDIIEEQLKQLKELEINHKAYKISSLTTTNSAMSTEAIRQIEEGPVNINNDGKNVDDKVRENYKSKEIGTTNLRNNVSEDKDRKATDNCKIENSTNNFGGEDISKQGQEAEQVTLRFTESISGLETQLEEEKHEAINESNKLISEDDNVEKNNEAIRVEAEISDIKQSISISNKEENIETIPTKVFADLSASALTRETTDTGLNQATTLLEGVAPLLEEFLKIEQNQSSVADNLENASSEAPLTDQNSKIGDSVAEIDVSYSNPEKLDDDGPLSLEDVSKYLSKQIDDINEAEEEKIDPISIVKTFIYTEREMYVPHGIDLTKQTKSPIFGDSMEPNISKLETLENHSLNSAAKKIQSVWRGHKARKDYKQIKNDEKGDEQKETKQRADGQMVASLNRRDELFKAATAIQSFAKGYLVRKQLKLGKAARETNQAKNGNEDDANRQLKVVNEENEQSISDDSNKNERVGVIAGGELANPVSRNQFQYKMIEGNEKNDETNILKESDTFFKAASVIQAFVKGHLVRKQIKLGIVKRISQQENNDDKGSDQNDDVSNYSEHVKETVVKGDRVISESKIQEQFTGYAELIEGKEKTVAANEHKYDFFIKAASVIQAFVRGHLVRKQLKLGQLSRGKRNTEQNKNGFNVQAGVNDKNTERSIADINVLELKVGEVQDLTGHNENQVIPDFQEENIQVSEEVYNKITESIDQEINEVLEKLERVSIPDEEPAVIGKEMSKIRSSIDYDNELKENQMEYSGNNELTKKNVEQNKDVEDPKKIPVKLTTSNESIPTKNEDNRGVNNKVENFIAMTQSFVDYEKENYIPSPSLNIKPVPKIGEPAINELIEEETQELSISTKADNEKIEQKFIAGAVGAVGGFMTSQLTNIKNLISSGSKKEPDDEKHEAGSLESKERFDKLRLKLDEVVDSTKVVKEMKTYENVDTTEGTTDESGSSGDVEELKQKQRVDDAHEILNRVSDTKEQIFITAEHISNITCKVQKEEYDGVLYDVNDSVNPFSESQKDVTDELNDSDANDGFQENTADVRDQVAENHKPVSATVKAISDVGTGAHKDSEITFKEFSDNINYAENNIQFANNILEVVAQSDRAVTDITNDVSDVASGAHDNIVDNIKNIENNNIRQDNNLEDQVSDTIMETVSEDDRVVSETMEGNSAEVHGDITQNLKDFARNINTETIDILKNIPVLEDQVSDSVIEKVLEANRVVLEATDDISDVATASNDNTHNMKNISININNETKDIQNNTQGIDDQVLETVAETTEAVSDVATAAHNLNDISNNEPSDIHEDIQGLANKDTKTIDIQKNIQVLEDQVLDSIIKKVVESDSVVLETTEDIFDVATAVNEDITHNMKNISININNETKDIQKNIQGTEDQVLKTIGEGDGVFSETIEALSDLATAAHDLKDISHNEPPDILEDIQGPANKDTKTIVIQENIQVLEDQVFDSVIEKVAEGDMVVLEATKNISSVAAAVNEDITHNMKNISNNTNNETNIIQRNTQAIEDQVLETFAEGDGVVSKNIKALSDVITAAHNLKDISTKKDIQGLANKVSDTLIEKAEDADRFTSETTRDDSNKNIQEVEVHFLNTAIDTVYPDAKDVSNFDIVTSANEDNTHNMKNISTNINNETNDIQKSTQGIEDQDIQGLANKVSDTVIETAEEADRFVSETTGHVSNKNTQEVEHQVLNTVVQTVSGADPAKDVSNFITVGHTGNGEHLKEDNNTINETSDVKENVHKLICNTDKSVFEIVMETHEDVTKNLDEVSYNIDSHADDIIGNHQKVEQLEGSEIFNVLTGTGQDVSNVFTEACIDVKDNMKELSETAEYSVKEMSIVTAGAHEDVNVNVIDIPNSINDARNHIKNLHEVVQNVKDEAENSVIETVVEAKGISDIAIDTHDGIKGNLKVTSNNNVGDINNDIKENLEEDAINLGETNDTRNMTLQKFQENTNSEVNNLDNKIEDGVDDLKVIKETHDTYERQSNNAKDQLHDIEDGAGKGIKGEIIKKVEESTELIQTTADSLPNILEENTHEPNIVKEVISDCIVQNFGNISESGRSNPTSVTDDIKQVEDNITFQTKKKVASKENQKEVRTDINQDGQEDKIEIIAEKNKFEANITNEQDTSKTQEPGGSEIQKCKVTLIGVISPTLVGTINDLKEIDEMEAETKEERKEEDSNAKFEPSAPLLFNHSTHNSIEEEQPPPEMKEVDELKEPHVDILIINDEYSSLSPIEDEDDMESQKLINEIKEELNNIKTIIEDDEHNYDNEEELDNEKEVKIIEVEKEKIEGNGKPIEEVKSRKKRETGDIVEEQETKEQVRNEPIENEHSVSHEKDKLEVIDKIDEKLGRLISNDSSTSLDSLATVILTEDLNKFKEMKGANEEKSEVTLTKNGRVEELATLLNMDVVEKIEEKTLKTDEKEEVEVKQDDLEEGHAEEDKTNASFLLFNEKTTDDSKNFIELNEEISNNNVNENSQIDKVHTVMFIDASKLDNNNGSDIKFLTGFINAATKIQSIYRGFRVRSKQNKETELNERNLEIQESFEQESIVNSGNANNCGCESERSHEVIIQEDAEYEGSKDEIIVMREEEVTHHEETKLKKTEYKSEEKKNPTLGQFLRSISEIPKEATAELTNISKENQYNKENKETAETITNPNDKETKKLKEKSEEIEASVKSSIEELENMSRQIDIENGTPLEPFYLHDPNMEKDNPIAEAIKLTSELTNQEASIGLLHSGEFHDSVPIVDLYDKPQIGEKLLHSSEMHDLVPMIDTQENDVESTPPAGVEKPVTTLINEPTAVPDASPTSDGVVVSVLVLADKTTDSTGVVLKRAHASLNEDDFTHDHDDDITKSTGASESFSDESIPSVSITNVSKDGSPRSIHINTKTSKDKNSEGGEEKENKEKVDSIKNSKSTGSFSGVGGTVAEQGDFETSSEDVEFGGITGANISGEEKSVERDSAMDTKRNNATIAEKNTETQAATKIQASFRGYQVRKQMQKPKNGSDIVSPKRNARRKTSGGRAPESKKLKDDVPIEDKSATKIQAGIRGFLVRRRNQKKRDNEEM